MPEDILPIIDRHKASCQKNLAMRDVYWSGCSPREHSRLSSCVAQSPARVVCTGAAVATEGTINMLSVEGSSPVAGLCTRV